ncbi:MAG TPA: GntR family transcriptional regulator [Desulfatiglandales bacterium]|nr:GntR family transcriptional regulator [Desulfatiglandales bacterium]
MNNTIDKNNPEPIYLQIKQNLLESIDKGVYAINQAIPSEMVMATQYQVSRMTVRTAINELVKEGFLFRRQGKGTYVSGKRFDYSLFRITSFNQDMAERGMAHFTNVLEVKVCAAPERIRKALELSANSKVIYIKRLRYAHNEPLLLEERYLNYSLCKRILKENLEQESIHNLLIYKYKLALTKVTQFVQAKNLSTKEANLLKVKVGSAALYLQRTTYTHKQPVTMVTYLYRGDRYRVYAEFEPYE